MPNETDKVSEQVVAPLLQDPDANRNRRTRGGKGRLTRILRRVLISLVLFLLVIELVFRFGRPSPRFQIIRNSRDWKLESKNGIPVWHQNNEGARANARCSSSYPSAAHVLFFGSSIFFGSGVADVETFEALLQTGFDARFGPGRVCVKNFAQPGYAGDNKLAVAREAIPKYPGAIVAWEVYGNDPFSYVFLGDSAYSLRNARRDGAGYPDAFGVPQGLNDFLFRHSRAYEYASLAYVPELPGPEWSEIIRARVLPQMDELLGIANASRSTLLILPAPGLSRPFREQLEDQQNKTMKGWAEQHATTYREIAGMLLDQDPSKIRLDECCHYNAAGHRVLSERFFELLLPLVSERLNGKTP